MALLSCFAFSGNAQDSVPTGTYGIQGNAESNRSVYEIEMQRAAQEARRMKELKAAIASQGFAPPPVITTADQFLAANRPAMPPPSERPEPQRPQSYVPEFENTAPPVSSPPSVPSQYVAPPSSTPGFEMPEKERERSFFKWMKGKKEESSSEMDLPPAGASEYVNPYQEQPPAPAEAPVPMESAIPDPPAMNEEVPAPIMRPSPPEMETPSEPAPIFVRREEPVATMAETATVEKDADAIVGGVLVKLFAGTEVAVLGKEGTDATVRLPDGRVGTVKRKSLSIR